MQPKESLSWKAQDSGELCGAAIHDGTLEGIFIQDDRHAYVIRNTRSERIEIVLDGVGDFNLVRFFRGAIVSEMFGWQLRATPAELWLVQDSAWNTLYEGRASLDDARASAARLVREQPDSYLFQLNCSYGGALAAICKGINLFRYR